MTDLWCVHVEGPDDMLPMPSKEAAEKEAERMNEAWRNRREPSEWDPNFKAVAKLWPYSMQEHVLK
jgi:hypothetical protein